MSTVFIPSVLRANVGADAPFLLTTTGLAGKVSPEARA